MVSNASRPATVTRAVAVLVLLLLPLSALGTRFGVWPVQVGLLLTAVAMLGAVLIQVTIAVWLLRKPNPDTRTTLRWACLFALPPLVVFASSLGDYYRSAPIHNISTDTHNPPQFVAAKAERGEDSNPLHYTEEVAQTQRETYPSLGSLDTPLPPDDAFARAVTVARDMGWHIYARAPEDGRIEAVDTTFWFGFKDDIAIRITPRDGGGSRLDLRSVSRVGTGDLGTNARRIQRFQDRFRDR